MPCGTPMKPVLYSKEKPITNSRLFSQIETVYKENSKSHVNSETSINMINKLFQKLHKPKMPDYIFKDIFDGIKPEFYFSRVPHSSKTLSDFKNLYHDSLKNFIVVSKYMLDPSNNVKFNGLIGSEIEYPVANQIAPNTIKNRTIIIDKTIISRVKKVMQDAINDSDPIVALKHLHFCHMITLLKRNPKVSLLMDIILYTIIALAACSALYVDMALSRYIA